MTVTKSALTTLVEASAFHPAINQTNDGVKCLDWKEMVNLLGFEKYKRNIKGEESTLVRRLALDEYEAEQRLVENLDRLDPTSGFYPLSNVIPVLYDVHRIGLNTLARALPELLNELLDADPNLCIDPIKLHKRTSNWYRLISVDAPERSIFITYPSKKVLVSINVLCDLLSSEYAPVNPSDLHDICITSGLSLSDLKPFRVMLDGEMTLLYCVKDVNKVRAAYNGEGSNSVLFDTTNERLLDWVHPTAKRVYHLLRNNHNLVCKGIVDEE